MPELPIVSSIIVALSAAVGLPPEMLEYGAFSLLVFIMVWHGRMMNKVIDRALRAFDKMGVTMESIRLTLVGFENRLERVEKRLEDRDKLQRKDQNG